MDARNLVSLAGVMLVIGATGWYWGMGSTAPEAGREERRPDYVITGIEALESDEHGRLNRRLTAPEVRHFSQPADASEIDAPVLTLYNEGKEAWQVSARQGRGLERNTVFRLEGGVQALRRDPTAVPVTVDTDSLQVYPKEERLEGRQRVTVKSPRGQLQSQGIQANLRTGDLVLTQNVQGNYAPPSR